MKRVFFPRSSNALYFSYYNHVSSVKQPHNLISKLTIGVSIILALFLAIYISTQLVFAAGQPVYSVIGVHPEASAQPTPAGKMLRDLAVNNGKLYAAYGDYNADTGPIHINPFNIAANTFEGSVLSVPTEAIYGFRSINGKLVAPMFDPITPYTANQGYAEQLSNGSWQNRLHVPMEHVFDVATLDGTDLWMAGHRRASDGTELDAVAYRSTDDGATWTVAQTDASAGEDDELRAHDRYYWMAVLNGKIYMQASLTSGEFPPVRSFDGSTWAEGTTHRVCSNDPGLVEVFAGYIVCSKGLWDSLQFYDGTLLSTITLSIGSVIDFYVDEHYLYVLGSKGVYRTSDLHDWDFLGPVPAESQSLAVVDDYLYIGTIDAELLRSEDTITQLISMGFTAGPPVAVGPGGCFAFDSATGTITGYHQHIDNIVTNPLCPLSVEIPNTINGVEVVKIASTAFYAKSLNAVTLPDTLTTIEYGAFLSNSIEHVFIPDSVTSLGAAVFNNNPLISLTIGTDTYTGSPQLSITNSNFSGMTSLKTVKIGNNVKEITNGAFSGNSNLSQVDLGHSVENIYYSFMGNAITSLSIPDSVIDLRSAFTNNPIQSVSIGTSDYQGSPHMVISQGFLQSVPTLQSITLGDSVKEVNGGSFGNLPNLTHLDLGESIEIISNNGAFSGSRLETVTLPESLVSIGSSVFASSGLKTVVIQGNPTILGDASGFLRDTGLDPSTIPAGMEDAEDIAIYRQNNAELVRIYATDPDFIAANNDSFYQSCIGEWNGSSYDPPCYVTSGYLINPASLELLYVNSADQELSTTRRLVSSMSDLVPDYRLIHILDTTDPDNQVLDFAAGNYYRLGDSVELTSQDMPSIAGYVTPSLGHPITLNALVTEQTLIYYMQNELDSMNGNDTLANTGINPWPALLGVFALSSIGALLMHRALRA